MNLDPLQQSVLFANAWKLFALFFVTFVAAYLSGWALRRASKRFEKENKHFLAVASSALASSAVFFLFTIVIKIVVGTRERAPLISFPERFQSMGRDVGSVLFITHLTGNNPSRNRGLVFI